MRRHFMLGTVFSAALAVGAFAQSEGQSPTGQQDANRSSNAAQAITVTGCLKADDSGASATSPGAPGAPANPTASSAPTSYILTEMSTSGAAASPTESPSPTATSGSSGKTYKLTGSASDFASLVGKKVEVKGTVQDRAGSASANAPESRPGSAMGDSSKAQLRVTSIKEVSGSCSKE
jgi:hypothetical protein